MESKNRNEDEKNRNVLMPLQNLTTPFSSKNRNLAPSTMVFKRSAVPSSSPRLNVLPSTSKSVSDQSLLDVNESKTETTRLYHLNYDCLLHIFQHLSLLELSIMWCIDRRFRASAESLFQRNYNSKIDLDQEALSARYNYKWILRSFGRVAQSIMMSSLSLNPAIPDNEAMSLLARYCYGKLEHLKLDGFELNFSTEGVEMRVNYCRMMSRLQFLHLKSVTLRASGLLFSFLTELNELHLEYVSMDNATALSMPVTYEKLHTINLKMADILEIPPQRCLTLFSTLLKANRNIKVLKFANTNFSSAITRIINHDLLMLDDLSVRFNTAPQITELYKSKQLKRLKLQNIKKSSYCLPLSLLSMKETLTHLDVIVNPDDFHVLFEICCNFDSLQKFVLRSKTDMRRVLFFEKDTTRFLPNLTDFRTNAVHLPRVGQMIQFMESRPMLEVFWVYGCHKIDVIQEMQLFAERRPPSAPKLIVIIQTHSALKVAVLNNLVVIYSVEGSDYAGVQAPRFLTSENPVAFQNVEEDKVDTEAYENFLDWCRNSAVHNDILSVESLTR